MSTDSTCKQCPPVPYGSSLQRCTQGSNIHRCTILVAFILALTSHTSTSTSTLTFTEHLKHTTHYLQTIPGVSTSTLAFSSASDTQYAITFQRLVNMLLNISIIFGCLVAAGQACSFCPHFNVMHDHHHNHVSAATSGSTCPLGSTASPPARTTSKLKMGDKFTLSAIDIPPFIKTTPLLLHLGGIFEVIKKSGVEELDWNAVREGRPINDWKSAVNEYLSSKGLEPSDCIKELMPKTASPVESMAETSTSAKARKRPLKPRTGRNEL